MARLLFERSKCTPGQWSRLSALLVGAISQAGGLTVGTGGATGAASVAARAAKNRAIGRPRGGYRTMTRAGRRAIRPAPRGRDSSMAQTFNLEQAIGAEAGADFRGPVVATR